MQERCRSAWRLREWFEIFRRYHLATMKDGTNRAARLRRYFGELEDLDPNAVTRMMIAPWFRQLGLKRHPLANEALTELGGSLGCIGQAPSQGLFDDLRHLCIVRIPHQHGRQLTERQRTMF